MRLDKMPQRSAPVQSTAISRPTSIEPNKVCGGYDMKKLFWAFVLVVVVIVIVVVVRSKTPCQQAIQSKWTADDLEIMKLKNTPGVEVRIMAMSVGGKPPYYIGPLPLEYQSQLYDLVPSGVISIPGGNGVAIQSHFDGFVASYLYPTMNDKLSHIPAGAIVSDENGKVKLAEATMLSKDSDRIEVEEAHYRDCTQDGKCCLQFRAKSTFNHNGYKIAEEVLEGGLPDLLYQIHC